MAKIVHVVAGLPMGGVSNVVFDLLKNYKSSPYDYVLVNLSGTGDPVVIDKFKNLEIPIINVPFVFQNGFSLIDYFRESISAQTIRNQNRDAFDAIIALKPDLLHFHTLPRELLFGKWVARQFGCSLVYTDHLARISKHEGSFLSRFLIRFPFIRFYSGCHVVAVSISVRYYLDFLGIPRFLKSLEVLTNKITPNNFRISHLPKQELKVVYVSRISKVKGHHDLINAWAGLPSLKIHLYVVGPDELSGTIQQLAAQSSMLNPVTFTGPLPDAKSFIHDADFAVFPSHQEGLPLALLEKMQIGLPCIVSDIPELLSMVDDDVDGLVFEVGNPSHLAEQIKRMAVDIELRQRLGQAAAHKISSQYVSRLGGIDKEYEELYKRLGLEANR